MQDVKQAKRIADFFRREHRRLVQFVRSWIEDAAERDGEDIVQDVALNIFDRADVSVPIDNLSAYVYQALRNRVIDLQRKKKQKAISLDSKTGDRSNLAVSGTTTIGTKIVIMRSGLRDEPAATGSPTGSTGKMKAGRLLRPMSTGLKKKAKTKKPWSPDPACSQVRFCPHGPPGWSCAPPPRRAYGSPGSPTERLPCPAP